MSDCRTRNSHQRRDEKLNCPAPPIPYKEGDLFSPRRTEPLRGNRMGCRAVLTHITSICHSASVRQPASRFLLNALASLDIISHHMISLSSFVVPGAPPFPAGVQGLRVGLTGCAGPGDWFSDDCHLYDRVGMAVLSVHYEYTNTGSSPRRRHSDFSTRGRNYGFASALEKDTGEGRQLHGRSSSARRHAP